MVVKLYTRYFRDTELSYMKGFWKKFYEEKTSKRVYFNLGGGGRFGIEA